MKTSEVLAKARDYLMEHGWCKEILETPDGRVCALGAIARSYGDTIVEGCWFRTRETANAEELLKSMADGRPAIFNDKSTTTFNDVIDLFDRAIIKAKGQEA